MESEDENVAAIKGSAMVYCTECGLPTSKEMPSVRSAEAHWSSPRPIRRPCSPEPPAGRPGVDHTKAVVIVLIALICVVALVIGLFITHSMGLWGAQPQAQTSAQSTGADALDSADDGTTDSSDAKSKAKKNTSDSAKDKNSDDSSKKSSTEKSKPSTPVITSSQLSDIADSYSSSDVAVSAMVIDGTSADSSEDATIATTSQSGKQFVAAHCGFKLHHGVQEIRRTVGHAPRGRAVKR